jgi:hypothetical protein
MPDRTPEEAQMAETPTPQAQSEVETQTSEEAKPEMCCDGQQTAEQHRHDSPDGKCCIDD